MGMSAAAGVGVGAAAQAFSETVAPSASTNRAKSVWSSSLKTSLWDHTKAVFTDPVFLVGMGTAMAAGLTIHKTGVDDAIARRTDGHQQLNTWQDDIGEIGGNPATHFGVAGLMYLTGLQQKNTKLYETSKTLISALAINGVLTQGLKFVVNTTPPNGSDNMFDGWPSGHTSSSFCFATVMYESYGPWVGVPLMGFAAYVGYERINARNHDFSDVISGMIIGIIVGHTVASTDDSKILGMELEPFINPMTGAAGVSLTKRW